MDHKIFRRAINKENSWTLIGVLESTQLGIPFADVGLEYGVPYSYTIIAYDEVGLKSKPAHPNNITLVRAKQKLDPFERVDFVFDEESKEVTLSWDLRETSRLERVLIYRGESKERMGKYKLLDSSATSMTDMIGDSKAMYYRVKPIYSMQEEDYFSETIVVVQE